MINCIDCDWFSGGWHGRGTFKVTFNSGGAIEFAEHFKRAVASGKSSLMNVYTKSSVSEQKHVQYIITMKT